MRVGNDLNIKAGDVVEREKLTIRNMIGIYCRGNRHCASGICQECEKLLRYAYARINACPYDGSIKPVCGLCRTNCFSPEMHRLFSAVMRYSGPRMMVRHPVLTLAHFCDAIRWKMAGNRKSRES
jgi:hypothetical protein